jgi:hypothetical protein
MNITTTAINQINIKWKLFTKDNLKERGMIKLGLSLRRDISNLIKFKLRTKMFLFGCAI